MLNQITIDAYQKYLHTKDLMDIERFFISLHECDKIQTSTIKHARNICAHVPGLFSKIIKSKINYTKVDISAFDATQSGVLNYDTLMYDLYKLAYAQQEQVSRDVLLGVVRVLYFSRVTNVALANVLKQVGTEFKTLSDTKAFNASDLATNYKLHVGFDNQISRYLGIPTTVYSYQANEAIRTNENLVKVFGSFKQCDFYVLGAVLTVHTSLLHDMLIYSLRYWED